MAQLLSTLILGFVQGTINALLGAGLVAVYRGTRVINFAHGAMAMVSTYVFVTLLDHHAPTVAAIVIGVLFGVALGLVIEVAVMRPLAGQSYLVRIIATLGILYVLQSAALVAWGGANRAVPTFFPHGGHKLGSITVSNNDIGVAVTAFGLAIALTLFYRYTRFGTAIRAVSNSRDAATLVGIRVNWVTAASWAIGGGTGALAGILLAPSLALDTYTLTLLVVQGFAAALTGRLESLGLALLGGIGLGIASALASTYVNQWTTGQNWINLTHIDYMVAFFWILGLLLIWRRPAATQQQAGGLLL